MHREAAARERAPLEGTEESWHAQAYVAIKASGCTMSFPGIDRIGTPYGTPPVRNFSQDEA